MIMAANERINVSMQIDNNDAKQRLREMAREVDQMRKGLDANTRQAEKLGVGIGQAGDKVGLLGAAAEKAGGAIKGMLGLGAVVAFSNKLAEVQKQLADIAGKERQTLTNVLFGTGELQNPARAQQVQRRIEQTAASTVVPQAELLDLYSTVRGELTLPNQGPLADQLTATVARALGGITDQGIRKGVAQLAATQLALDPSQDVATVLAASIRAYQDSGNANREIAPALQKLRQAGVYGSDAGEAGMAMIDLLATGKLRGETANVLLNAIDRRGQVGLGAMSPGDVLSGVASGSIDVARFRPLLSPENMRDLSLAQRASAARLASPAGDVLGGVQAGARGMLGAQMTLREIEAAQAARDRAQSPYWLEREAETSRALNNIGNAAGPVLRDWARTLATPFVHIGESLSRSDLGGGGRLERFQANRERDVNVTVTSKIEIMAPEGLPVQASIASGGE